MNKIKFLIGLLSMASSLTSCYEGHKYADEQGVCPAIAAQDALVVNFLKQDLSDEFIQITVNDTIRYDQCDENVSPYNTLDENELFYSLRTYPFEYIESNDNDFEPRTSLVKIKIAKALDCGQSYLVVTEQTELINWEKVYASCDVGHKGTVEIAF